MSSKNGHMYIALALMTAIIVMSIGTYARWWDLHIVVASQSLVHWAGIIPAGYIAVFTPIYASLKRRSPGRFRTLLSIHVFGNLLAFLLISMHFADHLARPVFPHNISTGLTVYVVVALMVLTGLMQRFRLANRIQRARRWTHVSLSLAFYIVVIMHVIITLAILH